MLLTTHFLLPAATVPSFLTQTLCLNCTYATFDPTYVRCVQAVPLCEQVPQIAWYATQREALGLETAVYAFLAVGLFNPFFTSPPFPPLRPMPPLSQVHVMRLYSGVSMKPHWMEQRALTNGA